MALLPRSLFCLVALSAIGLFGGRAAQASVYVVDQAAPGAADTNAGTAEAPFKTISAAVKVLKAGDTAVIQGGLYRESVILRTGGEEGKPVTIKAAAGQRVIISGAEFLTGWRKCTADDAKGCPNSDKLFVIDLDWLPPRLYEGRDQMTVARVPRLGWWRLTSALPEPKPQEPGETAEQFKARKELPLKTVFDTAHLIQKDAHAWDGWTVAIDEDAGGEIVHIPVAAFDPDAHQITMARPYSEYRKTIDPTRDRYFMENHLSVLEGPGQYVYEPRGKGCRIWAWPSRVNQRGEPVIEALRRGSAIEFTGVPWLVIDGLETCFSTGRGIQTDNDGPTHDVVIQSCFIHDNVGYGILLRTPERVTVRRNIIRRVSNGIVISQCKDTVVEENDIGPCTVDGLDAAYKLRGLKIRRNYVHGNYFWSHPDNLQFWTDCQDVWIEDNVVWDGGTGIMSEGMKGTRVVNNFFVGSHATMVMMVNDSERCELRNNTLVACGAMPTAFQGKGFTVQGNIFLPLHPIPIYSITEDFKADFNLMWSGADHRGPLVIKGAWKDTGTTVEEIRRKFDIEGHGLIADPRFVSVPEYFTVTDVYRMADCTADKFFLKEPLGGHIEVGDVVEICFDGVPRKVTEVGKDWLTFEPPLKAPPDVLQSVADWGRPAALGGEKDLIKWDLRLRDDSPARKAGEGGKDIGCNLDVQAYRRGDFSGSGKRDLPALPPGEE
jgi:hypothetical protein